MADKKMELKLSIVASFLITIFLYIFLHEAGHSLVAIACGAQITKFSILKASMAYVGGSFTALTGSLLNAAGMLLPVLVSIIVIFFYNKETENMFYRVFFTAFCVTPFFSTIAWIIIPILYSFGSAPKHDDVTKFLNYSGINPFIISAAAFALLVAGLFLAYKKKILQNYWNSCKSVKNAYPAK
ncbi:MAG: hypothetical protein ACLSWV_03905 [Pygmaiobacter massiliensis]